jgi:hypothetical protein
MTAAAASEAEGDRIEVAGLALWDAMAQIVDANPFYRDAGEDERPACIGRLVMQAFMAAAIKRAPEETGPYATISSAGRLIGWVLAQSPDEAATKRLMELLNEEIATGAGDFTDVAKPRRDA